MHYFDIIFFAIIAGILAIRLYRLLGRKTDVSFQDNRNIKNAASNKSEGKTVVQETDGASLLNGEGSAFLKNLDPSFEEKSFLSGAQTAFKLIIEAFNYDDKKSLRKHLEDDVFRAFEAAIIEREQKGYYVENPIKISIHKNEIESIEVKKGIAHIKVRFVSSQSIVTKDSETESIVNQSDASVEKEDLWEFSKEVKSKDPNWKLISTQSG